MSVSGTLTPTVTELLRALMMGRCSNGLKNIWITMAWRL